MLSEEALKEKQRQMGKKSMAVGDEVEDRIESILSTNPEIEYVHGMGNTGNKFDTIFKFRTESCIRGIQIKAMTKSNIYKDNYIVACGSGYENDTILTGINLEDGVYFVMTYDVVKDAKTTICFTPDGKWAPYFYKDKTTFTSALFEQIKKTTIIKDNDPSHYFYKDIKTEYHSLERLEKKCKELGLKYERNSTNTNQIDVFINGKAIQCKSSGSIEFSQCQFSLRKAGGEKKPNIPYTDKDGVDIFIFNILSPKLENRFYIIPINVLIERNFVKSTNSKGKTSLSVALPDSEKNHWTLGFLDKFSLYRHFG